jgi:hypothetical protein
MGGEAWCDLAPTLINEQQLGWEASQHQSPVEDLAWPCSQTPGGGFWLSSTAIRL